MKNKTVLLLVQAAMIAALYVIFTEIANLLGIGSQVIQVRFSEALTILPLFTPAAIPGLFIGCILGNLLSGAHILDVIFGSLATLAGALGTYFIGKKCTNKMAKAAKWLAPLPPIIANTIVIPLLLHFVYQFEGGIPFFVLTIAIGEILSCGVLGIILYAALAPRKNAIFQMNNDNGAPRS